ncbi:serine/threonine-protein kinase 3-like [Anthonomus grandis grandis]|uniref:serine/threonine-protein kinase 3-like n=1 Tax=Anthonomus grandis grandis TaxID=2921223 RepID=UPI002166B0C9|nr:serine/threonine-protein kinase 3-like [Anthonomus grandis grandis]
MSASNLKMLSEESLTRQPEEVFDIICKLGEGAYGSVYKALHKESDSVVAIKQVPLDTDLHEIIKEISIMQQCDSPYVVRYYGSYFKNTDLWIIMEYCGAGSVSDIIRLRKKTLTECEIATILSDALKGLEYLHSNRKIHRDIKAGNILLNTDGHAKLADFGVAGQLTETISKRNTVIGSPFWMAPEIILEIGYDCVADIWSIGITALEMAEGKPPYADIHPMRAVFMIPTKPPPSFRDPDSWSAEFIDFVSLCLVKNPCDRASATDLLQHVFLQKSGGVQALTQMISEANEIRKNQSYNKMPMTQHQNNQQEVDEVGATLVPSKTTSQSATMVTLQSDLGTMVVINSDDEDGERTMKSEEAKKYKPFFLEHFDHTDAHKSYVASHSGYGHSSASALPQQSSGVGVEPLDVKLQKIKPVNMDFGFLKDLSYEELKERFDLLDTAMEKEIEELQTHYILKKQPVENMIHNKRERNRNF